MSDLAKRLLLGIEHGDPFVWRQAMALAEAVLEIEERENRTSASSDAASQESS